MAHKYVNGKKITLTTAEVAAIEAERVRELDEDKVNNYELYRRQEYPSLVEQVNAIYTFIESYGANHPMEPLPAKVVKVLDDIQAVKDKYPKPEA